MDWSDNLSLVLSVVAGVDLLVCCIVGWQFVVGGRSLTNLQDVQPVSDDQVPTLSIVLAARNESRNIEQGMKSLLGLDYPQLEIIAVDDRSTDDTGTILDRLSATDSRLRVIHLTELPAGWLGKNHALQRGANEARGELILFTDADVVMDRSALRRAVAYLFDQKRDHLTALFRLSMPTWVLESFVVLFTMYFFAYFKPWKVRDSRSPAHIGAGGFNMIRSSVYKAIGGHGPIALRPDDDLKLGKLIKKHGYSSDVVVAVDLIEVEWYSSVGELVRGLEKNAFAGVDYNIPLLVGSSVYALTMHFGPFVAIFLTTGWTRWLFVAVVVALLALAFDAARKSHLRLWTALGFPLVVLLFVFIQWRTMLLNLLQGGIRWRDTFYPLADLKANRV